MENTDIKNFIRSRIAELLADRGISDSAASIGFGKSNNYLSVMFREKNTPSFETLVDICSFLDISLSEFFSSFPDPVYRKQNESNYLLVSEFLDKTSLADVNELYEFFKSITKEDMKFLVSIFKKYKNK